MAISPPSDIVLDVLRAADPQALEAAKAKLASMRGPVAGFEVPASAEVRADLTRMAHLDRTAERPESYVKFEAMVLQNFLQSMMPSDQENVYGAGMAGDIWKSMMAEQMAGVMAKRGGIGIAEAVLGDHYTIEGEKKVALTGATDASANASRGESARLTTALVEEMQRKLVEQVGQDSAAQTGGTR